MKETLSEPMPAQHPHPHTYVDAHAGGCSTGGPGRMHATGRGGGDSDGGSDGGGDGEEDGDDDGRNTHGPVMLTRPPPLLNIAYSECWRSGPRAAAERLGPAAPRPFD